MVFLIDKQPMDWEMSYLAATSPENAAKKVKYWIKYYDVEVIITERTDGATRKGQRTQSLLMAVSEAAKTSGLQHESVVRSQPFQSKYEQLDNLAERFPQLKVVAPKKRKYWENEPQCVTIFEALALVEKVMSS